jgi:hypothetical protein
MTGSGPTYSRWTQLPGAAYAIAATHSPFYGGLQLFAVNAGGQIFRSNPGTPGNLWTGWTGLPGWLRPCPTC